MTRSHWNPASIALCSAVVAVAAIWFQPSAAIIFALLAVAALAVQLVSRAY